MSTLAQVAFFLALVVVIVIHEAAHFGMAKRFGIKVNEFFVGFGPRLWSTMRGETEYGIKLLPAGGYVRIAGMNPYEEIEPEDLPRTFGAKPIHQRALVIVAGPITVCSSERGMSASPGERGMRPPMISALLCGYSGTAFGSA